MISTKLQIKMYYTNEIVFLLHFLFIFVVYIKTMSALRVVKHSKKDFYDEFCRLLDLHKFPLINNKVLPEICFAVYNSEGIILYSFWFYFTSSQGLAWLAFPVSNKSIPFKKREGAMEFLLDHISNYAKRKGIITLFTTSGTEGVINPLLKNGFDLGDQSVNHYIKKL